MSAADGVDALEARKRLRLIDNFKEDVRPLRKYLEDPEVTDIFVGHTGEIIVKTFGRGKVFTGESVSAANARGIILSAAAVLNKLVDPVNGIPKLEAVVPEFQARLTGLLPPWVERPEIAIRKPPMRIYPLEDYVAKGRLKQEEYELICRYIRERKNLLVGGGTGSGKTTFANAVLRKMTEYAPDDRFYIVEDAPELQCGARDTTRIEAKPGEAAEAVRTALRWTPDRIIFGELRYGSVAYELLKAWNTGHPGGVTTIHADSCASMLRRVEDLLREEIKGTIPKASSAIHLCAHLTATAHGPVIDEALPVDENDAEDFISGLRRDGLA
jgi:type IV secretion system protein VirB11